MPNTASICTTCPDGGKMAFKVEVLNEDGTVMVVPQKEKPKGPNPQDMLIEVEYSDGTCSCGYKVGDKWQVKGLKTHNATPPPARAFGPALAWRRAARRPVRR